MKEGQGLINASTSHRLIEQTDKTQGEQASKTPQRQQQLGNAFVISMVCSENLVNPSNAEVTFYPKNKDAKIFENHLNPVMLVFI